MVAGSGMAFLVLIFEVSDGEERSEAEEPLSVGQDQLCHPLALTGQHLHRFCFLDTMTGA